MTLHDAIESINDYVVHGLPPGGFLTAVLANDLMQAIGRADSSSLVNLEAICRYVYNDIPAPAHGSYDIVYNYIKTKQQARQDEARG